MAHTLIAAMFDKVQRQEIVPHVHPVPGMEPLDYVALISRRFSNPCIVDTTRRVAFDGSSRHTGFLLPTVRDALKAGTPVEGLALVEALWARMCAGTREDGTVIEPNDPHWDRLTVAAEAARTAPGAWLGQTQFYGDLGENARFRDAFSQALSLIWAEGTEAALRRYLGLG
jgi:mannitol 2-dehydrogenase